VGATFNLTGASTATKRVTPVTYLGDMIVGARSSVFKPGE